MNVNLSLSSVVAASARTRRVFLRVVPLIAALAAFWGTGTACAASSSATDANRDAVMANKNVLYVTRLSHRDREEDDKVIAHLEQRGMVVKLVDEDVPVSAANGEDLVIISSVVSARDMVGTPFRDVPVPLLTWESDLFDSLRFTGQKKGEDFGEVAKEHYVNVVNAPSPLAGGVPAGKRWVYPRDDEMGWGKPGPGATIVATIAGEPTHAVVFAYERGATMDYDFLAPARRVALFLGNRSFEKLSADGSAIFDAAVNWAVSEPTGTRHR
ncbi:hypothetical protein [Paraburkholderia sp. J10-1]|uniref:hypothetical protein n=1 Tax=Paraburkholderia sp. J10-1 TaxID=2805430 RepID=UPI002AB63EA5|nr:hypothetical protein [Paraburkholderia sp. J10-1]